MPKQQTTGEFMATLRKANGYTQQDVAEKLNISNRTLSSWETDRTLPDVLMLPAIADLYGVTVDELLRGERTFGIEKPADISENSLKNVYKNKYGSFGTKYALLIGIALICIALFIVGCSLGLWSYAPDWLEYLLMILGVVGLCACIAVIAYQYNNVKTSIGVILDEDLTDDKKAYLTALRHKLENFILCCALPFAIFALLVAIIFLVSNPQSFKVFHFTIYIRYGYILVMCLNFALSAILFVAYLILKSITVKKFYSETQQATAKRNRKLAGKIAAFSAIPIAVVILVNVILTLAFPYGEKVVQRFDDFDEFKNHMQTLEINGDFGIPIDEYLLPLPNEKPEHGAEFDLGNGFYGTYYSEKYISNNYGSFEYHREYWAITYGKPEHFTQEGYVIEMYQPTWLLKNLELSDGKVVNARYNDCPDISFYKDDNQYYIRKNISSTLTDVTIYTCTIIPICTVVTCAVIYAVKRKRQKYNF